MQTKPAITWKPCFGPMVLFALIARPVTVPARSRVAVRACIFCNVGDCRKQFSVTVGTVFERSKIPLNKWVLATHLMSASKTGVSAHQLHRMLDITYKSAWFMCHRIREAMGVSSDAPPMGGEGEQVQSDETYLGNTSKRAKG